MNRRDFRCAFSGVSLLNAEVVAVLLLKEGTHFRPFSLPLFGVYEGHGTVAEVNEGPNADLILAWFQQGLAEERVQVDFAAMGLKPQAIDHIETLLSLVACSQIQGGEAVRASEGQLGFALLSAHIAATLMEGEPALPSENSVEDLPRVVFDSELGRCVYSPLRHESHRLRCRFGLSMVGLAALDQAKKARGRPWCPPGSGIEIEDAEPALWLAGALVEFADSAELVAAIEDYSRQAEDEI
jgi:hypothetical protein